MKNAKVVSRVSSNKPDGLSIALIVILLLIIIACILWYIFYKNPNIIVFKSQTEEFDNNDIDLNQRFFQKNDIGREVPTDPVHVHADVLEGSLMTGQQIDDYFGSAKKKRQ
jgi:hypothetical protein